MGGRSAASPVASNRPSNRIETQVPLARIGKDNHDCFAVALGTLAISDRDGRGGPAGDTGQDAFFLRQSPGKGDRLLIADLFDAIDQRKVQHLWNESGSACLDLMRPGLQRLAARVWVSTGLAAGSTATR